jgi:hypothetical protein
MVAANEAAAFVKVEEVGPPPAGLDPAFAAALAHPCASMAPALGLLMCLPQVVRPHGGEGVPTLSWTTLLEDWRRDAHAPGSGKLCAAHVHDAEGQQVPRQDSAADRGSVAPASPQMTESGRGFCPPSRRCATLGWARSTGGRHATPP